MRKSVLIAAVMFLASSAWAGLSHPAADTVSPSAGTSTKNAVYLQVTLYHATPGAKEKGLLVQRLVIWSVEGETVPYEYSNVPNPYMNSGVDPRAGSEYAVLKLTSNTQADGQVTLNIRGDVKLDGRETTLDKQVLIPKDEPIYVISPNPADEKDCKQDCKAKFVFEFSAIIRPLSEIVNRTQDDKLTWPASARTSKN